MAFPQTNLRWLAEAALGADLTASPSTWSWTDVSAFVKAPQFAIRRGRANEFTTAPPSSATLTLINNDGRWVERNPSGVWYGTIGFNTPMRFMISPDDHPVADTFGRTVASGLGTAETGGAWAVVGTAGDYAATSGVARITHTAATVRHYATLPTAVATLDWTVRIRTAALATGAPISAGIVFRYVDANNSNRAELLIHTDQSVDVQIKNRLAGVEATVAFASTTLTHAANTYIRLRVQYVRGATNIVRIKAWADNATQPSTWQTWGTISAAATTGLRGLTSMRETGNTNANATVDFEDLSGSDGYWVRHAGYIDALPRRWPDRSATVTNTPTTVSGLSQRLQQGGVLASAIRAGVLTQSVLLPKAYWPGEDGTGAIQIASGLPGGLPMRVTAPMSLGTGQVNGSDPLVVTSNTGRVVGTVQPYTGTDWTVMWLISIPAAVGGEQAVGRWQTTGTYPTWQLVLVPGTPDLLQLRAYDANFVEKLSDAGVSLVSEYGTQAWVEVNAQQVGADVQWTYTWYQGVLGTGKTGTKAGITAGQVTEQSFGNGSGANLLTGSAVGHWSVWNTVAVSLGFSGASGYAGELTTDRFTRVARQGNVPVSLTTIPATVLTQMGPPTSGTALAQMREVETAEQGVLYDDGDAGMTLLVRESRYNRTVALALDLAQHHIRDLVPDNDSQQLVNDATSSQPRGSSYRYSDTTSSRSVTKVGYFSKPFQPNLFLPQELRQDAEFRVALGTVDRDRYTAVEISLTANPSLITAWLGCDIGSRIQITNTSTLFTPDTIDLIIEGYEERVGIEDWTVTLYTSPAEPWNAWILENGLANLSRLDSEASTLTSSLTTTGTSASVTTTAGFPVWITGGSLSIDLNIGGERVTVTAITGASSPQTFTLTRSVNGVVKTQAAGTKVSLWNPAVLAR